MGNAAISSGSSSSSVWGASSTAEEVLEGHDLSGNLYVITGANTGIGKETARALASRGAECVLGCRNEAKAAKAVAEIVASTGNDRVRTLQLDTSDLASVAGFAAALDQQGVSKIDGLVNSTYCTHPLASQPLVSVPKPALEQSEVPIDGRMPGNFCARRWYHGPASLHAKQCWHRDAVGDQSPGTLCPHEAAAPEAALRCLERPRGERCQRGSQAGAAAAQVRRACLHRARALGLISYVSILV
jgi:hypothetical protein